MESCLVGDDMKTNGTSLLSEGVCLLSRGPSSKKGHEVGLTVSNTVQMAKEVLN